jgi:hypothetical protein
MLLFNMVRCKIDLCAFILDFSLRYGSPITEQYRNEYSFNTLMIWMGMVFCAKRIYEWGVGGGVFQTSAVTSYPMCIFKWI